MIKIFRSNFLRLNKINFGKEYIQQNFSFSTKMAQQNTIFDKIIAGEIKSDKVYEDDKVLMLTIFPLNKKIVISMVSSVLLLEMLTLLLLSIFFSSLRRRLIVSVM